MVPTWTTGSRSHPPRSRVVFGVFSDLERSVCRMVNQQTHGVKDSGHSHEYANPWIGVGLLLSYANLQDELVPELKPDFEVAKLMKRMKGLFA
ncbi:hypothetical protein QJS10_CPB20g01765 [Acorus calamus]|uniref:Uncharacterized protein n=1 Tax=Acorus calamus TaxID=4465 RepID=A0AAV9C7M1_ACOCL|nr:hypothetical protein QJS10_CPB20g01765 [Acorus calamus]